MLFERGCIMVTDFHHFKGLGLSRSERIQRKVVELLLESAVPNSRRESSIAWELKHSAGCCQIGRILAQKRGLDVELAEIACVLHDIYVIVEGTYGEHARRGAAVARKLLEESGGFSEEEIGTIAEAVAHHSEKDIHTSKPYVELAKEELA